MATPSTSTYDYRLPIADVAKRYLPGDGDRFDQLAGIWAVVFYALFAAYLAGYLNVWLFGVLGVCAFVRNFNALHEGFHAKRTFGTWTWARHLFVVTSRFMLGYKALKRNHSEHHTWAQQPEMDPDAYLAYGSGWLALFNAITQPEQGFLRYASRRGLGRDMLGILFRHAIVFAAVAAIGGWSGMLAWVVVTRIGNTASWFIFDWILHQTWAWGRFGPPGMPRPIRVVWIALFGKENLLGIEYHYVHHHYPFVPGSSLPALGSELGKC